ncbi:MAG: DUF3343 domain-containing protein [Eubacterium sp.]|nr:DUF3343 domain-containing protein [Eubacterium sp.]
MFYTVKVGTITNAQRARAALKYRGIKSDITRLKNPSKGDGCGYAVVVSAYDIDRALDIIENEGVYIRGVEVL